MLNEQTFDLASPPSCYSATTAGITVSVWPAYMDDQSEPETDFYVFGYQIRIENDGAEMVRLINRHWRIIDSYGRVREVDGAGVVGEQPLIAPGDVFEYASGAPLTTPSGIMTGHFEMMTPTGQLFLVEIPAFSLDSPHLAICRH